MFIKRYFKGISFLWQAVQLLLKKPKLITYTVLPALISFTVYLILLFYTYNWLSSYFSDLLPSLSGDDLLSILFKIFWLLLVSVIFFFFTGYTFLTVSKIFSAPFNDLLSEKIEIEYNSNYQEPSSALAHFFNTIIPTVYEELKKVTLILSGFLILYLLVLIPMLSAFIAPLIVLYSILVVAIDFVDYPLARRLLSLKEKKEFVRKNLAELLGFGTIVFLLFMLPFLGLLVLQLAVVAATLLFIDLDNKDSVER